MTKSNRALLLIIAVGFALTIAALLLSEPLSDDQRNLNESITNKTEHLDSITVAAGTLQTSVWSIRKHLK